jgi:DHA1 family tetracycline resistance protein-like MFS transporter
MLGILVLAVSQFIFGFGVAIKSLAIILVSRAVAGLAAANFSIAQAAIADITPPAERAKNFGLIGAAFGIGFIVGPLLGGWVAHFMNSAAAPFVVAGILGIINLISCMLFLPETHKNLRAEHNFHFLKGVQNLQAAVADKQVRGIYLASFLYTCGFAFLISFAGILLVDQFKLTEAAIGTYFGVVGIMIVITQLFVLRIVTKYYNEKQILRVSLLGLAVSIALYPFMGSMTFIYTLLPFIALSQGLSIANMGSLLSKSVPPDRQGVSLGINGSLMALAQGSIPLLAGVGAGVFSIKVPFIAGGIFIFFAWLVLFFRSYIKSLLTLFAQIR